MKNRALIAVATVLLMAAGCTRVPDNVIKPDDMSELLADLQVGDAVVESNPGQYVSMQSKQALKQAILKRHGVSQEMLDTSLMWYGRHIDVYDEVYEETENILQKRLDKSAAVVSVQSALNVSGDSVDVWSRSRRMAVGATSASEIVTFNIKADAHTKQGDSYTWRVKFYNSTEPVRWGITANYTDGTKETMMARATGEGWQQLSFMTDSTKTLTDISGYMILNPAARRGDIFIDSIQLVRNRLNPRTYMQRYRQRAYKL